MGSWLAARQQDPGFLLLRYEDMMQKTDVELVKIARFLGIDPKPERIQWAIGQSTADRMRKLEQKEAGQWESTKDTRKDKFFVRSAKSGEGKATLSAAAIARIEAAWGPLMLWLGYETAASGREVVRQTSFLETVLEQPAR